MRLEKAEVCKTEAKMAAPSVHRVTAWINRTEWETVYSELYSSDVKLQQHAVDKLAVWKSRFGSRMSAAVVVSHEIMATILSTETDKNVDTKRMLMAMALVRFVNLMTDQGQNKLYAQPVHVLASGMDLPEWLVTLRHESTHSNLPSVNMLREGCSVAMSWLKEHYWQAQLEGFFSEGALDGLEGKEQQVKKDLSDILLEYMQYRFNVLFQLNEESTTTISDKKAILEDILQRFQTIAEENFVLAVEVLVSDGYFVVTDEQMEFLEIAPTDFEPSSCKHMLPKRLVLLWKPLIKCIHRMKQTVQLLEAFIDEKPEVNSMRERQIMGWISVFVKALMKNSTTFARSDHVFDLYPHAINMKVDDIIIKLLDRPNRYTGAILQVLWPLAEDFTPEQLSKLQKIVGLILADNIVVDKTDSNREIFTVSQLCEVDTDLNNAATPPNVISGKKSETISTAANNPSTQTEEKVCSTWCLADSSIDWHRYPLGSCPGYVDGNATQLELFIEPAEEERSGKDDDEDMDISEVDLSEDEVATDLSEGVHHSSKKEWTDEKMSMLKNELVLF